MTADSLAILRTYRGVAPWNLRDLAASASVILDSTGVRPTNAVAARATSERTIRFYIARGLVSPPTGHGTAATYTYRHLLQVLAVKLRQMEGASLRVIAGELEEMTGDVLERRVATALGPRIPEPGALGVAASGRAFRAGRGEVTVTREANGRLWRRITVAPGAELHLADTHPLTRQPDADQAIVEAVRAALGRVAADRRTRG